MSRKSETPPSKTQRRGPAPKAAVAPAKTAVRKPVAAEPQPISTKPGIPGRSSAVVKGAVPPPKAGKAATMTPARALKTDKTASEKHDAELDLFGDEPVRSGKSKPKVAEKSEKEKPAPTKAFEGKKARGSKDAGKDAKEGKDKDEDEESNDSSESDSAPEPSEPTKEDLAEAQAEAEKALKEMERQGGGDSTLSRYFREMANHRVLLPHEEVNAAKEVEELEVGYWEALFAYVPAFETVATTVQRYCDQPLPELATLRRLAKQGASPTTGKLPRGSQKKWDSIGRGLAEQLRILDSDRIFVAQADRAVHRLAGDRAVERDIVGDEVRVTTAFRQYLDSVESAQRAQQRSKNRFVAANLRLVVSIARRYNRGRLPLIDLIQEGNIGLMKAVERFDHKRGYRFSTYASWWIRHAISRALADKGRAVRIPVHMLDTYNRVARATQAIATRTGAEPTPEELEKETGIAADKLEKIKGFWAETPFSLDRPVNDEDGRRFIDFLEQENVTTPHENLVNQTWSDEVRRLLKTLSPMEARILRWRFGLDDEDELTLKEIGDKYNLSRERIRQLQEQALSKIRRQIKE